VSARAARAGDIDPYAPILPTIATRNDAKQRPLALRRGIAARRYPHPPNQLT